MRGMLNRTGAQRLHFAYCFAEWNAALYQQLCGNQAGTTRTAFAVNGDVLAFSEQSLDTLAVGVPGRLEWLAGSMVVFHWQVEPLDAALLALLRQILDFVLGQFFSGHQG